MVPARGVVIVAAEWSVMPRADPTEQRGKQPAMMAAMLGLVAIGAAMSRAMAITVATVRRVAVIVEPALVVVATV